MDNLNQNWVTEGTLDFEYKKYLLLAYLKHCRDQFGETKLYPPLSELVQHYHSLRQLQNNLSDIQGKFPKELKGLDSHQLKLSYESTLFPDEHISTITEIAEFAIPSIKGIIEEGKEIYEFVEHNIEISPVGIVPVYNQAGYVLLCSDHDQWMRIYQFEHSVIATDTDHLHSLSLNYLFQEKRSVTNTAEQIKLNLIKQYQSLPQPATYLCMSRLSFPIMETLLPVTKRLLMKKIF
jgi:benzoyl-CoA reductase/2-hydroxyglutaryl-CoA dehydratase subunit BcrC/BadD/HgdB